MYDFFRQEFKLSDEKAREAVSLFEDFKPDGDAATKDFVRAEINALETKLTTKLYWLGIGQIIVILGGLIAIIKFMLEK